MVRLNQQHRVRSNRGAIFPNSECSCKQMIRLDAPSRRRRHTLYLQFPSLIPVPYSHYMFMTLPGITQESRFEAFFEMRTPLSDRIALRFTTHSVYSNGIARFTQE